MSKYDNLDTERDDEYYHDLLKDELRDRLNDHENGYDELASNSEDREDPNVKYLNQRIAWLASIKKKSSTKYIVEFPKSLKDLKDRGISITKTELTRLVEYRVRARAAASAAKTAGQTVGISTDDFYAYLSNHKYIYTPTGEIWTGSGIDKTLPPISENGNSLSPTEWLDKNKAVHQMTWYPGMEMIISNKLIEDGGWIEKDNVRCYNIYRPPTIELGNSEEAGRWIEHVEKIYSDDAQHITNFFAHILQKPAVKINHGLLLGGSQGIGKDTMIEPLKYGVGPWNFEEVGPTSLIGTYNSYLRSVVLRISEVCDLGTEMSQRSFYERMKTYTASPPDMLRVNEKYIAEYMILNCCGVIMTTNHKTDGIYLPADDRRHYVAWSACTRDQFSPEYWKEFWGWYDGGGIGHVVAYLASLDISQWNAKEPPRKTPAFWEIVNSSLPPEDGPLADTLDALEWPDAVTVLDIYRKSDDEDLDKFLKDRRNSRLIPKRLEDAGYVKVMNRRADDGLWKIGGKRQAIYGKASLSERDRMIAAEERAGRGK